MTKPLLLRSASLLALTLLLAPARFYSSSSSQHSCSTLLCAAATTSPADAEAVATHVPRHHHHHSRSLWELSVVWDKVGQFIARLTSGWHTDKNDCAKEKSSLSGMTSLASSNATTATAATTTNDTSVIASRLLRQLDEEQRALKLVQVPRSEEVTRHERVWAADVEDKEEEGSTANGTATTLGGKKDDTPTLLGEHMEHHASWSTMLQEVPDDDNDAHRRRQLLLYPQDIEMNKELKRHHHKDDEEDEEEDRGPYYSKDDGLWRIVHKRPLADALEKHGHHGHRTLRAQTARVNMTETEFAEIREEAREALVEVLRQASKEKEDARTDPNVAKSLEAVLDALAVRRPSSAVSSGDGSSSAMVEKEKFLGQMRLPGSGGVMGTEPDVANPLPPGRHRSLRGLQQQQVPGAGVAAAIASGFTEQQKAEMRQIMYDAALSMIREAAREAMSTNQGGNTGSGSTNFYPSNQQNKNGPVNQDAYAAAYNALINAISSKQQQQQHTTTMDAEEGVVDPMIASHYGGPGGVGPGDNTGGRGGGNSPVPAKKKSFLEVARDVARHNSPSAGRPPALRGGDGGRQRALKDVSFRIPVPFTRDETSNGSTPTLKFNETDAIFVQLRQTDTRSMQDEAFSRIRPLGPIIEGSPRAIGGETVHDDPLPRPLPGSGHGQVDNPMKFKGAGAHDHEWAEMLLQLLHEHREKKERQKEQRTQRLLAEEGGGVSPPVANPVAPATATPPAAPADAGAVTTTTTNPPTLGNMPNLDLNALAGLLQQTWVGPVPGGMGNQPKQDPSTAPVTDALGNVIQKMKGGGGGEGLLGPQEPEKKAVKEMEEKKEKEAGKMEENRVSGGDLEGGFHDRASSQLMSHSARNFQKMQEAVNSILAQEGAFGDMGDGDDFWK